MKKFRRLGLLVGAVLALILAATITLQAGLPERAAFTGQWSSGQVPIAPEISAFAPLFTKTTLDGRTVALADLREAPVIINFWATWCQPCRIEMPELQAIYEKYHTKGLRLLAVNLGESSEVIEEWKRSLKLTFDIIVDEQQDVAAMYYLRGQPSTYIVAPGGIISAIFFGPVDQSRLERALAGFWKG